MSTKKVLSFVETKVSGTSSETSNASVASSLIKKLSFEPRTSTGQKVGLEGKYIELNRKKDEEKRVSIRLPQQRVTRMFQSINVKRPRQSIIIKPVLKFKVSYRLESKNPFNPRVVEDLVKKIVETEMKTHEKVLMNHSPTIAMCRSLSEEILRQVKAKQYDRYRIIVNVTAGEKHHQSFRQNALVLWDSDKDALANYVYEQADIFVIASVYGVYYD